MDRNWCCSDFQMHASHPDGGLDGFRMLMIWRSNRPFLCRMEYRPPDRKHLERSDAVAEIKFCPWCGANLNQQYGAPVAGSSAQQ
jgi:hypothetical protein